MTLTKLSNPKNRSMDPWMNNVFETLFSEPFLETRLINKVPAVNISESKTGYRIELAAPGLKKGDFKINLEKDILSVSAEQKEDKSENSDEKKRFSKREFNFQSFTRSFNIPESINTTDIQASYEDGILSINLIKKEEEIVKQRFIEVK